MKKTLAVVLAILMATTMVFTLVSCGSDEDKVKDLAKELNEKMQADSNYEMLKELGMDIAFEARGTELVIAYILSDDLLDMMPEDSFAGVSNEISSYASADEIKKECPAVSKITVEVRGTNGDVVYSEEMK